MYRYNQDPALPSLSAMQAQVLRSAASPLAEGYQTYTGYRLSRAEAESQNAYIETALEPTYFNDQQSLSGLLDRKHKCFVMAAEQWEYVVGLGYVHPSIAQAQKENTAESKKDLTLAY